MKHVTGKYEALAEAQQCSIESKPGRRPAQCPNQYGNLLLNSEYFQWWHLYHLLNTATPSLDSSNRKLFLILSHFHFNAYEDAREKKSSKPFATKDSKALSL